MVSSCEFDAYAKAGGAFGPKTRRPREVEEVGGQSADDAGLLKDVSLVFPWFSIGCPRFSTIFQAFSGLPEGHVR